MKKIQKGFITPAIIAIIAILAIGWGIYYSKNRSTPAEQMTQNQTEKSPPTQFVVPSEIKYKTYENDTLKISFEYPEEWGDVTLTSQSVDPFKCEGTMMKTYLPNRYHPTDKISFSKRNSDYLYVGLVKFSQTNPNGCDDGGTVNLVEERNKFISQKIGVIEQPNGWKEGVSKNDQGNIFSYYPDYHDGIGTGISQIYDMFGPNLLVQAWIDNGLTHETSGFEEVNKYKCKQDQKYGTCGLTQWLRQDKTSKSLKKDFDGMDHLIKTFKFI